jgi:hypothetical protein
VNTRDGGEVDDDDVFQAELNLAKGKLELYVLERDDLSGMTKIPVHAARDPRSLI